MNLIRKRGDELAILAGTLNFYPGFDVPREFAKEWKIVGVDSEGAKFLTEGVGKEPQFHATYPADRPTFAGQLYHVPSGGAVAGGRIACVERGGGIETSAGVGGASAGEDRGRTRSDPNSCEFSYGLRCVAAAIRLTGFGVSSILGR